MQVLNQEILINPELSHACFIVILFFSVKSDCIRVMGAQPSLLCYVHTFLARPDIVANENCHLIGRDDENILSSCIDQSNDTLHLIRYMHTKQQRWRCTHHKNTITLHLKKNLQ